MNKISQIINFIKLYTFEIMSFFILLFLIFLIFYYNYNYNKSYKNNLIENIENKKSIEIVVSRFNEDLNWLNEYPFSKYPVILYNKGLNNNYNIHNMKKSIKLLNVGRESHTYLYHIINNYDNLADITIFLPGSANSNIYNKKIRSIQLVKECEESNTSVIIGVKHTSVKKELYNFKMERYKSTTKDNNEINPETKLELSKIRPYGAWYEHKFPNTDIHYIPYSGIIAISKEHILQNPKVYYEKLIDELSYSSNPEVGHYFERSWVAIFNNLIGAKFIDASVLF